MANGKKQIFISIPAKDLFYTGDGQPFHETAKAYGFSLRPSAKMVWIPKSLIKDFTTVGDDFGYTFEFWIPEWICREKEIEKYKSTAYEPTLFEMQE